MMKLDVYVDAGSHENKFSIGVVFYTNDIEIYKVSEIIDSNLDVNTIQNAELYAIDKALSICKEASITKKDIIIHCDNQDALSTAKTGVEFKNCSKLIKGHVCTYKGQLTKTFNNTIHFLKISSSNNHGKAHEVASDALNGKVYEEGNKYYLALSSKDIMKRLGVKPSTSDYKIIENTLNINKIFEEAGSSFIKLQEDLFKKKKELMDLKVKLMNEKATLSTLNSSIKKYNDSILTLKQSVNDAKANKDKMLYNLNKGRDTVTTQEKRIAEMDRQIQLRKEEIQNLYDKEALRLKIYQEEYERLIQEIEYLRIIKSPKCEVM